MFKYALGRIEIKFQVVPISGVDHSNKEGKGKNPREPLVSNQKQIKKLENINIKAPTPVDKTFFQRGILRLCPTYKATDTMGTI